ncbi:MAG: hypothetical protein U0360_07465 [Dehalococcoidia bacterium]
METKPFGFFPTGWDVELLNVLGPAKWTNGKLESRPFEGVPGSASAAGSRKRRLGAPQPW